MLTTIKLCHHRHSNTYAPFCREYDESGATHCSYGSGKNTPSAVSSSTLAERMIFF
jgi:hypothetical protein